MSSNNNKSQAILLVTDKYSPVIQLQYDALVNATEKSSDVFIAYHRKADPIPSLVLKSTLLFLRIEF